MFSFAEFEAACKLAISSVEALSRVVRVERVVGITDYEEIFATHTAGLQLVGITNLQEVRISVNTVGAVQVLYKEFVTTTGWFPRPVPHISVVYGEQRSHILMQQAILVTHYQSCCSSCMM